jgi:hypothetical protein
MEASLGVFDRTRAVTSQMSVSGSQQPCKRTPEFVRLWNAEDRDSRCEAIPSQGLRIEAIPITGAP